MPSCQPNRGNPRRQKSLRSFRRLRLLYYTPLFSNFCFKAEYFALSLFLALARGMDFLCLFILQKYFVDVSVAACGKRCPVSYTHLDVYKRQGKPCRRAALGYIYGQPVVRCAPQRFPDFCLGERVERACRIVEHQCGRTLDTVSYTHLDVYKRQHIMSLSAAGARKTSK